MRLLFKASGQNLEWHGTLLLHLVNIAFAIQFLLGLVHNHLIEVLLERDSFLCEDSIGAEYLELVFKAANKIGELLKVDVSSNLFCSGVF